MDYLFTKYLHILGVVAFMGGLAATLILRHTIKQAGDHAHKFATLRQVKHLDQTLTFYGGLTLLLAGLTASMIPDTKIYHSWWVMTGFSIFLIQVALFFMVRRATIKQLTLIQHSPLDPSFWHKEGQCRILIALNLLLGITTMFFMVTKFSPH